jgi:hypothetical protein
MKRGELMSINWDLYNTRLNMHGTTERDRVIKEFQISRENKGIANPSSKTVIIDGVEKQVLINSKADKSKFSMSPISSSDTVQLGAKVVWNNATFLVTELSIDHDVFVDAIIQQCNYVLPFQNDTSTIYQEPCIIETNKITDGVDENKILTLPNDIRIVKIQYNDNTKMLCEGKRIFLDMVRDKSRVYKITNIDTVTEMNGNNGLWVLTCKADGSYNPASPINDRKDLRICNYIPSSTPAPSPTPTTSGSSYIAKKDGTTIYLTTDIVSIREGGTPYPFSALFKDTNGNVLTGLTPTWTITNLNGITANDITLVTNVSGYPLRCTIQIANKTSLIGATFRIHLVDSGNTLGGYDVNCKVVSFT